MRRRDVRATLTLGVTALGVAGLSAPTYATAAASRSAPGCHPEWPVVAHHAGGGLVTVPASQLPVACATPTGYPTSETTVAVTNDGTVLFSPAQSENSVARSSDDGRTWTLSTPPDEQRTALWNTVDPYLAVDRRTGRVFWIHSTGPTRTTPLLVSGSPLPTGVSLIIAQADGFQVDSTDDGGARWHTADYSTAVTTDWQKIFVGPPRPADTGAPQPSGYPDVVYVCANSGLDVWGPSRLCYRSLDGGDTFSVAGFAYPSVGAPDACMAASTNAGIVLSDGTVLQPFSCQLGAYLAVSRDEGVSYSWVRVPSAGPGGPAGGLVGGLEVAADAADNIYAVWETSSGVSLTVSRDHAASWSTPIAIAAPSVRTVTLAAVAAGAPGELAVTYYGSADPSAQQLSGYITQTSDATDAQPVFYSGIVNDPAHPIYTAVPLGQAPRADYVTGAFDAHGSFRAALVDVLGPPDAQGNWPTTGYLARLASRDGSTVNATIPSQTAGGSILGTPNTARVPAGAVGVDAVALVALATGGLIRRRRRRWGTSPLNTPWEVEEVSVDAMGTRPQAVR